MAWTFSFFTTAPFLSVSSALPSGDVKGEETGTIALSSASKCLVVDIPYIEIRIVHENTDKIHVIMFCDIKECDHNGVYKLM
jgi:hypothetical protein